MKIISDYNPSEERLWYRMKNLVVAFSLVALSQLRGDHTRHRRTFLPRRNHAGIRRLKTSSRIQKLKNELAICISCDNFFNGFNHNER